MKTITIVVATKDALFAVGTVEEEYKYTVAKVDGTPITEVIKPETSASFTLDAGDYVVTVSKNGFSATGTITVTPDEITFQVPATLTITVA